MGDDHDSDGINKAGLTNYGREPQIHDYTKNRENGRREHPAKSPKFFSFCHLKTDDDSSRLQFNQM